MSVAAALRSRFAGPLWSHHDFLRLWLGQSVSMLGTRVTIVTVPTLAIVLLHAPAAAVGLLYAVEFVPWLILGLPAGVLVDRLPRRPVMVAADLGRTLALLTVPVAWVAGALTLTQLFVVVLVTASLTTCFDVAYGAYLPYLTDRRHLLDANAKLELSRSAALIAGPPLAGFLIQWVGAALTLAADAASYVVSAGAVLAIRRPEGRPDAGGGEERPHLLADLLVGLRLVVGDPLLRSLTGSSATINLGNAAGLATVLLLAYRDDHLTPAVVGVSLGLASVAFVAGAVAGPHLVARFGVGRVLLVCPAAFAAGYLLIPLGVLALPAGFLALGQAVINFTLPVYNMNVTSLIQATVPDRLMGRAGSAMLSVSWGTLAVGSLAGGLVAGRFGAGAALVAAGAAIACGTPWLVGGVNRLRHLPEARA